MNSVHLMTVSHYQVILALYKARTAKNAQLQFWADFFEQFLSTILALSFTSLSDRLLIAAIASELHGGDYAEDMPKIKFSVNSREVFQQFVG